MDLTQQFQEIKIVRNGVSETIKIPMLGQGSWNMGEKEAQQATTTALESGYVCIDTAQSYQGSDGTFAEKGVGQALHDAFSGNKKKRENVFIISKLDPTVARQIEDNASPADKKTYKTEVMNKIADSFENLQLDPTTDYLDMYYIHAPFDWSQNDASPADEKKCFESVCLQWEVLNELYNKGKIKALGICNFSVENLNKFKDFCTAKNLQMPHAMQMPMLIGHQEEERLAFCERNNIQPVAYSVLGSKYLLQHELVQEMAKKYQVSPAQLCVYYSTQVLKLPSLTKATRKEQAIENSQIKDFKLSKTDIDILKACRDDCRQWDIDKGYAQDEYFDKTKVEASKNDSFHVLDFLKYSGMDFKDLNAAGQAAVNDYIEHISTVDTETITTFINQLTPSKAVLLDSIRKDYNGREEYLRDYTLSAFIGNISNETTPIDEATISKIYEIGWNKSISSNLAEWLKIPEYRDVKQIKDLAEIFRNPTYTAGRSGPETEPPQNLKGNLIYKGNNDVSYIYLPYKTADNRDTHLRVMQYEGKLYINFNGLDTNNPEKPTTCEIIDYSFTNQQGQKVFSVFVDDRGQKREIKTPVTFSDNKNAQFIIDFEKLARRENINPTEIEIYDCPRLKNIAVDRATSPIVSEEDSLEKEKLLSSKRKGQKLEKATFKVGEESFDGLTQSIVTEKTALKTNQTLTLLDSASYKGKGGLLKGALLTVTTEGNPSPVALFTRSTYHVSSGSELDTLSLKISKQYLADFLAENKNLKLPEGELEGDYVTYEVDKLKLSENLTIEDVQIKAANPEFAVLFSALGLQIIDKDNNRGVRKNTEKPFNIGVSSDFLKLALEEESKKLDDANKRISIEKNGVGYQALLITRLQQERAKKADPKALVKVDLPGETLYSVPFYFREDDGIINLKHLNIRKDLESGKTYAYLHISGESSKSATVPRFHEINLAHLEASKGATSDDISNTSLYLGLNSTGKNVARVNIRLEFDHNEESLGMLKDILSAEFGKSDSVEKEKGSAPLLNKPIVLDGKKFDIYPIPTEASANILSFEDVAILSRKQQKTDESPIGQNTIVIPNPNEVDRPQDRIIREETHGGGGGGGGGGGNPPQPPPPPTIKPIEWESESQKDRKEKQKKEKADKANKEKKDKATKYLIGGFALCTLISIILPFFQIIAIILGIIAIINDVKPWSWDIKGDKKESTDNNKELKKIHEKYIEKTNAILNVKNRQLTGLQSEREKIENNKKLTQKQKAKKLKKLDATIKKQEKEIEKLKSGVVFSENSLKLLELEEKKWKMKKDISSMKKENQKVSDTEKRDLKDIRADLKNLKEENKKLIKKEDSALEAMKEQIVALNKKKEELSKEKEERDELKRLEEKNDNELSDEDKEKLNNLRKKFGKKKDKTTEETAGVETEIETLKTKQQEIDDARAEREREISEKENEEREAQAVVNNHGMSSVQIDFDNLVQQGQNVSLEQEELRKRNTARKDKNGGRDK